MSIKARQYGKNRRLSFVLGILALATLGIVAKQVYLQTVQSRELIKSADKRTVRAVYESALRGIILDREGEPLAVSSPVSSIVANPRQMMSTLKGDFQRLLTQCRENAQSDAQCPSVLDSNFSEELRELRYRRARLQPLADVLAMDVVDLINRVEERSARGFYYLKRQVPPAQSEAVMALALPGISKEDSFQRFYPDGELTGQIVGFTDVEDRGQEGIERQYDDWLSGQKGKMLVLINARRNPLSVVREEVATAQGQNLQLSIDKRIQYLMRRELLGVMESYRALSASAVMVDVQSGEILGMVSLPDGNPNNPAERIPELMKNHVITDVFEPGSTIKPIAVAAAMQAGVISAKTQFSSGTMRIGANRVRDTRNYGSLDTTGVIRKSSNVGMAIMSQKLPRGQYFDFLGNMGFGQLSGLNFPGEQRGYLPANQKLGDFSYATTFFGYGISTTALQIAHAYATIGNNGVKVPLTLTKRNTAEAGVQVIKPEVAQQVLAMMQTVVEKGGTGTRATMESYTSAGKTGTSHKVGRGGYMKDKYRALFAGLAPAKNPRIALVIVVDEPQGEYYGGLVAAPSFAKIAESSLKLLGVLPDNIGKSSEVELTVDKAVFEDNDLAGVSAFETE